MSWKITSHTCSLLALSLHLGSLVHYIDEVWVRLEVDDILDRMIGSIQETCHSLLIIFRDISSYHCHERLGHLHSCAGA